MAKNLTNGVAVIGLGRFGQSLALELMEHGEDVLGIDTDPRIVADLAGRLTHVVEADSTNQAAMRQLSVHEFSRVVIGMGNDLEASILSAGVALELLEDRLEAPEASAAKGRLLIHRMPEGAPRHEAERSPRIRRRRGDRRVVAGAAAALIPPRRSP